MRIGYARTSTVDQVAGLEAQLRELEAAGCVPERIYREQLSSVAERPKLDAILDHILHPGDELVVTRIDRLARSIRDLVGIIDRVHRQQARLHILSLGSTDPNTPIGRMMVSMLGTVAEFERDIMLERQRAGIAKARAEGKYKGGVPTVQRRAAEIRRLAAEGVTTAEIASRLGCNRTSVWRVLKQPLAPAKID